MQESRYDSLKRLEPELWERLARLMSKVQSYGFQTDMDEMFHLVGVTLLICRHELPRSYHRDLLGDTLVMEFYSLTFRKRRRLIEKLDLLYVSYMEKRNHERKKKKNEVAQRDARQISQKALVVLGDRRKRRYTK